MVRSLIHVRVTSIGGEGNSPALDIPVITREDEAFKRSKGFRFLGYILEYLIDQSADRQNIPGRSRAGNL